MKKNEKIKVMTVVGTRPEIIRLSETIKELDAKTEHVLVHTGQNYDYELNEIFFKDLGLRKPDYFLSGDIKNLQPMAKIGEIFSKIEPVLEKERPDAFLVLGDTNSCLTAYAAKRRKIPVFHMEAGNRCFDERVPEEINRRIIDHISDINMVYSERARDNLIAEGLSRDRIIFTGSPMMEVLKVNEKKINDSKIIKKLKLAKGKYFVVSFHREENVEDEKHFKGLLNILDSLAKIYNLPIIFSVHPRTRQKIDKNKIKLPKTVHLMKPLGLFNFVALQKNSFCVLSDSGTISEESTILGFPAVNLRETHERQEAMDESPVVMAGVNPERVLQAIDLVAADFQKGKRIFKIPNAYYCPNVSKKVTRIILSYIDYVNRRVWFDI